PERPPPLGPLRTPGSREHLRLSSHHMTSLELNTPHVACDLAEGEALLIHFRSGRYFSARGAAAELLRGALAGRPSAELLEHIRQVHGEHTQRQAERFI